MPLRLIPVLLYGDVNYEIGNFVDFLSNILIYDRSCVSPREYGTTILTFIEPSKKF